MSSFRFKKFSIQQYHSPMKVCTDSCLFGSLIPKIEEGKILDIGTGTGLLAMMAAQINPTLEIDAVEINEDAIKDAEPNFENHPFYENLRLHFLNIKHFSTKNKYHLIICNPPYFEKSLQPNHKGLIEAKHQESLNLLELCEIVKRLLHPEGRFKFILPQYEASNMINHALEFGLYVNEIVKVYNYTHQRPIRWIVTLSFDKKNSTESDLFIYQSKGAYTDEVKKLLSPFYIYL